MKYLIPTLALTLTALFHSPPAPTSIGSFQAEAPTQIAKSTKQGVSVEINQLQLQRIGPAVQLPAKLEQLINKPDRLKRTIALSISQSGQGKSSGPMSITLRSGEVLNPCLNGNQRFMSVLANAKVPRDVDYIESWFEVPESIEFADIFPITILYETTDQNQQPVSFKFEKITP